MWLYFRADRLQAVSQAVGQAIARQAPWLKHKIVVIPYAIPEGYFSQPADSRREPVVLYVGRIAREKGIELLIEGFARLQRPAMRQTAGACASSDRMRSPRAATAPNIWRSCRRWRNGSASLANS